MFKWLKRQWHKTYICPWCKEEYRTWHTCRYDGGFM